MGKPKKEKPMSKKEEQAVDAMLEGVEHVAVPPHRKNDSPQKEKQSAEVVRNILREFLSAYIIIGYNHNEDAVVLTDYSDSRMRQDAVLNFLDKVYEARHQHQSMIMGFHPDQDFDDEE